MTTISWDSGGQPLLCLDTSVLLNIPRREEIRSGSTTTWVPYMPQHELLFDFYVSMCEMVESRVLVFPSEVERETRQDRKDDLARAFTQKAWTLSDQRLHTPRADLVERVIRTAFSREAVGSERHFADPRVIAIALTQRVEQDRTVSVACEDDKMDLCCDDLNIPTLNTHDFIRAVLDWRDQQQSIAVQSVRRSDP